MSHADCINPACQALADRCAWLEEELSWRKDAGALLDLKLAFGLQPKEAAVLEMLRKADGVPVARWRLQTATLGPDEQEDSRVYSENLVSVYITRLRAKLGHATIVTLRGRGYAMTLKGLVKVNGAMR